MSRVDMPGNNTFGDITKRITVTSIIKVDMSNNLTFVIRTFVNSCNFSIFH